MSIIKNIVAIYKIISPTGKVYIGQTWNLKDRVRHYSKLRCEKQRKLYNSFIKYGFDAHKIEIICQLPQDVMQDVLNKYEQLYMDAYRDAGIVLLNLKEAGNNGKHCEETKRKMSAIIKSEKQRQVSRENLAIANKNPRTQKQLDVWKKIGHYPVSEKMKAIGLKNLEKGQKRERTEQERQSARERMLKLNARIRTPEQLEKMRERGRNAGKLPRTEKQINAARTTFIKMHKQRRNLKQVE